MYGHQRYQQEAAATASPAQLILMLFDGALGQLDAAQFAIDAGQHHRAHEPLTKAQSIVNELIVSLDMERGGVIATNLAQLYSYTNRRLVDANVSKDPEIIKEVHRIISGIRNAWDEGVARRTFAEAG